MLKAILFDLDGTLLPMDMEEFTQGYFTLLAAKAAKAGYEREKLIKTIWHGTGAMVKNDGSMTNEDRFWQAFAGVYGEKALADKSLFDDFYRNEFAAAVTYTQPQPQLAREILTAARARAERVILATNPIFPAVGVETRLSWIGLRMADFDYVTTYESSHFCKPEPRYYTELLQRAGVPAGRALMIGNDVREDMEAAGRAGIAGYLVRDCQIGESSGAYPSGLLEELPRWLSRLAADEGEGGDS